MTELNSTRNTQEEKGIPTFDKEDVEKNKVMAGLAYIIFFLPLIACPDSAFGRFHANQGLLLFIFGVVGSFLLGLIPIIGWIYFRYWDSSPLSWNNRIGQWSQWECQRAPVIGKFRIIK